jgi:hypothetical protein
MSGPDEIRAQALEVAGGWSPPGAPRSWRLTAALFESIAADDELLERLAVLPADRLPALLASAAIAFLVRRERPVRWSATSPNPAALSRSSTTGSSQRSRRSARGTRTISSRSAATAGIR